jgi:uncharacterized protein
MAAPDEATGSDHIVVRVATALGPRRVTQRDMQLPTGARLRDAVATLAGDELSPEFVVGVWGRVRPMDWLLHDGDRIELSRALKLDPMEARRLRHQHQKDQPKPRRVTTPKAPR